MQPSSTGTPSTWTRERPTRLSHKQAPVRHAKDTGRARTIDNRTRVRRRKWYVNTVDEKGARKKHARTHMTKHDTPSHLNTTNTNITASTSQSVPNEMRPPRVTALAPHQANIMPTPNPGTRDTSEKKYGNSPAPASSPQAERDNRSNHQLAGRSASTHQMWDLNKTQHAADAKNLDTDQTHSLGHSKTQPQQTVTSDHRPQPHAFTHIRTS